MQVFFVSYSRLGVEGRGFGLVSGADGVVRIGKAVSRQFGFKLGPDAARGGGIGEENRAERDVARAGREQLERVAAARDSAHSYDGQTGRLVGGEDCREGEGSQGRAREAARSARQDRAEGALVESH